MADTENTKAEVASMKMPDTKRKKTSKASAPAPKATEGEPSVILNQPVPEVVTLPYQPEKRSEKAWGEVNYKNPHALRHYLTDTGKIRQRRSNSPKAQRRVAKEIKRARFLALIPYMSK